MTVPCNERSSDAQMDAWLAAMKRLEAHSRTATDVRPESKTAPAGPTHENRPAQVVQVTQTTRVATQQAKPVAQEVKPAAAVTPEASKPSTQAVAVKPGELNGKPGELDGDALLATLDEETAKDIRIMRRMSFGQHTVRELLAEYQAKKTAKPAGDEAGKSKSWWRR
jgi:hypothetical protein